MTNGMLQMLLTGAFVGVGIVWLLLSVIVRSDR
jgi:hypothetical protein